MKDGSKRVGLGSWERPDAEEAQVYIYGITIDGVSSRASRSGRHLVSFVSLAFEETWPLLSAVSYTSLGISVMRYLCYK